MKYCLLFLFALPFFAQAQVSSNIVAVNACCYGTTYNQVTLIGVKDSGLLSSFIWSDTGLTVQTPDPTFNHTFNCIMNESLSEPLLYYNYAKIVTPNGAGLIDSLLYENQYNYFCDCSYLTIGALYQQSYMLPFEADSLFFWMSGRANETTFSYHATHLPPQYVDTYWAQNGLTGMGQFDFRYIPISYKEGYFDLGETTFFFKNDTIRHEYANTLVAPIRHGNGRDWWVVIPDQHKNIMYVRLLTPYGEDVLERKEFVFDTTFIPNQNISFMDASMDGSKIAYMHAFDGIRYYDFDRCDGTVYNAQKTAPVFANYDSILPAAYNLFIEGPLTLCVVRFSPNNKYLYYRTADSLFQLDLSLQANEVWANRYVVATLIDPDLDPYTFNWNAPISGSAKNGVFFMPDACLDCASTIENLNAPGDSVIYTYAKIPAGLPGYLSNGVPSSSANYQLFDLQGGVCDTLGIDGPPVPLPPDTVINAVNTHRPALKDIQVWPNPVHDIMTLRGNIGQGDVQIEILDLTGRFIESFYWPSSIIRYNMDLSTYNNGMYLLVLNDDTGKQQTRKFVVLDK